MLTQISKNANVFFYIWVPGYLEKMLIKFPFWSLQTNEVMECILNMAMQASNKAKSNIYLCDHIQFHA